MAYRVGNASHRRPKPHTQNRTTYRTLMASVGAVLLLGTASVASAKSGDRSMPAPQSMFVSGHSLTNKPIPRNVAEIAASFGFPLSWNQQHLDGSSIKQRSRGNASDEAPWTGYAQGIDRSNARIDVLDEFDRQKGTPYDVLLITEQHHLLGSLIWNDTILHFRDFQRRFAAHNPRGVTHFYEPWLPLDDKSDPRRWIAYEREAAPVWQCVIAEMNSKLVTDGRHDRIVSLPASSALAYLLERATQEPGIEGITRSSVRSTVDSLVSDSVHLTSLGNYYISLVTFASIFSHSVEGAWHPADVTAKQASALQSTANEFVQIPRSQPMQLDECRSYVRRSFLWTYLGYTDKTNWRRERGYFGSLYLRLKLAVQWSLLFASSKSSNPFAEAAYIDP